MKNLFMSLALVLGVAALGAWAVAADEKTAESEPWFDMEGCTCCKHLGDNMDMLMEVQWENHLIKNGGIMTAAVPEKHKKRWDAVCKTMEDSMTEMASEGKDLPLCNFCKSYGALMEAGANMEDVETGFGSVTLITSDDPEVVKLIHKHFKRTQEESKKFEEMMKLQQQ